MIGTSGRDSVWRESFRENKENSYGGANEKFLHYAKDFFDSGKTAIDIASGNGRYAIELAKIGYKTTAIEYAQSGVKRIIENATNASIELEVMQGDMTKLYNTVSPYDLVLSSGLLEEVDKIHHKNIITGYQRATTSGGLCMIKWCIEISGRGVLVDEGWIQKEFENSAWEILVCKEKKEMKHSHATIQFNNEFDANSRTGTVIARKEN